MKKCDCTDAAERPQYYEIHKYRVVMGISLTFMAIDLLGGIFSLLSLVFKRQFDVLAAVAYSLVVVRSVLPPPWSLDGRVSIRPTRVDKCLKLSFFPVLLTKTFLFRGVVGRSCVISDRSWTASCSCLPRS